MITPSKSPTYKKHCRQCGDDYSEHTWRALPLISMREEEPGLFLEMRKCKCGAALGLETRGTVACRVLADEAERLVKETQAILADVTDEILDLIAHGEGKPDAAP